MLEGGRDRKGGWGGGCAPEKTSFPGMIEQEEVQRREEVEGLAPSHDHQNGALSSEMENAMQEGKGDKFAGRPNGSLAKDPHDAKEIAAL